MQQQNSPSNPPATQPAISPGVQALKNLVAQSQQQNQQAVAQGQSAVPAPAQPPPPPIRTDSVMGLLQSLKDRASYAFFGPQTPPTPQTPPK